MPKALSGEAEANHAGGNERAGAALGDRYGFEPAFPQFDEAGNDVRIGIEDSRLEPVPSLAAAIPAAEALRDDAFAADLAHRCEQITGAADHIINAHDARWACGADDVAQQCLPVLDRATAQIVASKVQEVEHE